jgi:hypothetical protein
MAVTVPFDQLVLQAKADLEEKARVPVRDLFKKIVMRTPVRRGRARANWNVSEGAPNYTYTQETSLSRALAEVEKVMTLPADSVIFLANGIPYIRLLEYGGYPNPPKKITGRTVGGFSSQAPAGMVRISVAEFGGTIEGESK